MPLLTVEVQGSGNLGVSLSPLRVVRGKNRVLAAFRDGVTGLPDGTCTGPVARTCTSSAGILPGNEILVTRLTLNVY